MGPEINVNKHKRTAWLTKQTNKKPCLLKTRNEPISILIDRENQFVWNCKKVKFLSFALPSTQIYKTIL